MSVCCWGSLFPSVMPACNEVPTLGASSLVSKDSLSSSTSVVACTRGGRPGGSITGKAGTGLEVKVTGTTATGAIGERAAAMGTSGLASGGSVSEDKEASP